MPSKHSLIGELPLQELVITAEHQKTLQMKCFVGLLRTTPTKPAWITHPYWYPGFTLLSKPDLPDPHLLSLPTFYPEHSLTDLGRIPLLKKIKHELQIHIQSSLSFKFYPLLDVCGSYQGSLKHTRSTWSKSWILWLALSEVIYHGHRPTGKEGASSGHKSELTISLKRHKLHNSCVFI